MERGAWTAGDEPVVGIVTESDRDAETAGGTDLDALESVVAGRGGETVSGTPAAVAAADATVLVAPGERALTGLVRRGADGPILPIGSVAGVGAVAAENGPAALETLLASGATKCRRPLLTAEIGDDRRFRGLFDVSLVTDEPATISEYGVHARGKRVSQFRADGVVAATPAGSHGYAGVAAGGPRLSADVDGVAVVPIAPFVMRARHWVLPPDRLSLSVERDEADVTLCLDDRAVESIGSGTTVSIDATETVETLVVAESRPEFGDRS